VELDPAGRGIGRGPAQGTEEIAVELGDARDLVVEERRALGDGSAGPATRTWRCAGTSQCSTAAARGFAASSAPLSLSQSVKKTSPGWRPRSTTRRAEGMASLVALATVMASGIGCTAPRAASSHVAS